VLGQQSLSIIVRAEGTRGTMTALEPCCTAPRYTKACLAEPFPEVPACQPRYNICPRWPSKPSG
jgi:hypothetical protein